MYLLFTLRQTTDIMVWLENNNKKIHTLICMSIFIVRNQLYIRAILIDLSVLTKISSRTSSVLRTEGFVPSYFLFRGFLLHGSVMKTLIIQTGMPLEGWLLTELHYTEHTLKFPAGYSRETQSRDKGILCMNCWQALYHNCSLNSII